jgi:hypothetical protein
MLVLQPTWNITPSFLQERDKVALFQSELEWAETNGADTELQLDVLMSKSSAAETPRSVSFAKKGKTLPNASSAG